MRKKITMIQGECGSWLEADCFSKSERSRRKGIETLMDGMKESPTEVPFLWSLEALAGFQQVGIGEGALQRCGEAQVSQIAGVTQGDAQPDP